MDAAARHDIAVEATEHTIAGLVRAPVGNHRRS
jgi:hypothetical protein